MKSSPPSAEINVEYWQNTLTEHGYDPQTVISSALWKHWQGLGMASALQFYAADILGSVITRKLHDPIAVLRSAMTRHQQNVALGKAPPELAPDRPQKSESQFHRGDLIWIMNAPGEWGPPNMLGEHPAQVIGGNQHILTIWPIGEGTSIHLDLREPLHMRAAQSDDIEHEWVHRRQEWLENNATPGLKPASDQGAAEPPRKMVASASRPKTQTRVNKLRSNDPEIILRLQFGGYLPGVPAMLGGPPDYMQTPPMDPEGHLVSRRTPPLWSVILNRVEEETAILRQRRSSNLIAGQFSQERSA